ncbi:MAG: hypothetical protein QW486_03635 [Candidatus Bathyarchaeia archaeon]|nr:hypothetical protein [Candidatus Bathyarchaeota archaeon]
MDEKIDFKEKAVALAIMALALIGISAAWATQYTSTVNITSLKVEDMVTITKSDVTISQPIPTFGWFTKTANDVFKIEHNPNLSGVERYVRVILLNAPEVRNYLSFLTIKVTVDGPSDITGYLTLTNPEILLDTTNIATGSSWTIDLEFYGYAYRTGTVGITLYCSVEPAKAVEPS